MKHLRLLLLSCLCALRAFGGVLNPDETKALMERASSLNTAFDKGDAETIIAMTHPSIYSLTNGKDGFEQLTRLAMEQVRTMGITIIESSLGAPTRTYPSGTNTVCFIPRTTVMSVQGKKAKSIGFLIAVRGGEEAEWFFLDGSGVRKNPARLKLLLPGLPADVRLPENRVEQMDEAK